MKIIKPAGPWRPAVGECDCGANVILRDIFTECPCGREWHRDATPVPPSKFRKQIAEALGSHLLSYSEREDARTIYLTYGSNTVTFDVLAKISKICGTKMINFDGEKHEYRISEVTGDTSYSGTLSINGVQFKTEQNDCDAPGCHRNAKPTVDGGEFCGLHGGEDA